MELPLITLLDRLDLEALVPAAAKLLPIRGVRLLTPKTALLEEGMLYVGSAPLCPSAQPGAVLLLDCPAFNAPEHVMFAPGGEEPGVLFCRAQEVFEYFCRYEERILEVIYKQRGLQALIMLCSEIMGNPAYLVDSSFKVLAIDDNPLLCEISAIWKNLVSHGYLSLDIVNGLRKSDELKLMESYKQAVLFDSKYFNNIFINYNLRSTNRIRGHLFVVGYLKRITEGDVAYVNRLGKAVLDSLGQDTQYGITRGREYENFLIHVLSGALKDKITITRQLKPLDLELEGRYCVFRYVPPDMDELLTETIYSRLENLESGKPLAYEEGVICVFPLVDQVNSRPLEKKLAAFVDEFGGLGGLSDEFDGFYRLHTHYQQALAAIELGIPDGRNFFTYRQCAMQHLFRACEATLDLALPCEKAIFRLRDHDLAHGTQYLATLEAYLQNERNIAVTSQLLFVHRNTLIYRIGRAEKILGMDLDDYTTRFRLMMSLYILRYWEAEGKMESEAAAH